MLDLATNVLHLKSEAADAKSARLLYRCRHSSYAARDTDAVETCGADTERTSTDFHDYDLISI